MRIEARLIVNVDDAVIFWKVDKPIDDCWGFAIEKESIGPDGETIGSVLDNRMGFERDKPKLGERRPSTIWPLQRFWWADFTANLGDRVRYRVAPMVHRSGKLRQLVSAQSEWTEWATLSGGGQDGFSSFFNRGLVISQFMSRYLEDLRVKNGLKTRKEALSKFKQTIGQHELPIRNFLSGALRTQMLGLLEQAKKGKWHVYAALYELDDDELIAALGKIGRRAHVVLSNGSIEAKTGEPAAEARKRDQNKRGRKALVDAGVEVFGRFVSPGALGHNKFLAIKKTEGGAASLAWTGSTNWTSTGLCTQVNNGLLIRNAEVAAAYFEQWERLRDAQGAFPKELVDANDLPAPFKKKGATSGNVWFTRTHGKVDLAALDEVVRGAREGVLFLMFQPGGTGTLKTIRDLRSAAATKDLYIKGVVSTLPPEQQGQDDPNAVDVSVVDDRTAKHASDIGIVQPEGANAFANWAATVTRNEFITRQGGVIGFAIVHSKLIVVDPFTRPVVVTGSHNFSASASQQNDDNFMIVRGNRELALHYATHILSVYHHYSWLAYLRNRQGAGRPPSGFLQESDTWQAGKLKGASRKELDFWIR